MLKSSRGLAPVTAGFLLVVFAFSARAQSPSPPFAATTLNISATGEVRVSPDLAVVSLGVQTDAPTAVGASRANALRMTAVLAAVKAAAIPDRDVQTARLSMAPQFAYDANQPPRLTGFRASNQITVTVADLSKLGDLIDLVVNAGATDVGEISFNLANPVAAENSARLAAVKKLQEKAALYTQVTGFRESRLVNLVEGSESAPGQPMPMAMAARVAEAPTPVRPGQIVVRIDVSGLFELTR